MNDAILMPPNSTALERALDSVGGTLSDLPVLLRECWIPADCPEAILPWLAWSFGVEEWDNSWSLDQKRATIAASIPAKRIEGSIGSVRDAIAALGITARVQEWFAQIPAGAPYTYALHIEVDQIGYDLEQLKRLVQVCERYKNLRSHLTSIKPDITSRSTLKCAAAALTGHEITVGYSVPRYSDGSPALDLMTDSAIYGEASTVSAIDTLHSIVHTSLPELLND